MAKQVLAIVGERWRGYYLSRQIAKMGDCLLFDITNNVNMAKRFSILEANLISSSMVNIGNEWVQVVPVKISGEILL